MSQTNHYQTVVFLIRHGERDRGYSLDPVLDGPTKLTERGYRQATAVGQYLAAFAPVAIYSSPLPRCLETAEAIAQAVGYKEKVSVADELIEYYQQETDSEVDERGEGFLATIVKKYSGQQIVCVTHQYVIQAIIAELSGQTVHQIPCDNAEGYRLVFADEKCVDWTHIAPAHDI